MKVQQWPIDKPKPYPNNPREISEAAITKVAASLEEFGFQQPIVVDRKGVVIVGHTRLQAARRLGLKKVPVLVAEMPAEKANAYRIADNRTNEEATWDQLLLRKEIEALEGDGIDLALTGFDDDQLERLMAGEDLYGEGEIEREDEAPNGDPDQAPAANKDHRPDSERGSLYELGPHRLLCGDSGRKADVDMLLGDEKVECVWTDPPYGVSYVGGTEDQLTVLNDDLDETELLALLRASLKLAHAHCKLGAPWYVAAPGGPLFHVFGTVLRELEVWRETILWVKDSLVLSRQDYHWRHEPLFHGAAGVSEKANVEGADKASEPMLYGWKDGGAHFWRGGRKQDTVWEIPRPKRSADHPTMKPVALVQRSLLNSTRRRSIVYDPFGGSGTTMIASAKAGCHSRLIELSPMYCDVIRRRWTTFAKENDLAAGSGALAPLEVA